MRRPITRSAQELPDGHEFIEGGKRMRIIGHTIKQVQDKPAQLFITKRNDDELIRQAASANARLLAEMDKPSFLNRAMRFIGLA